MIVVGVIQSLMALSTISPNLSEQFGALVSLAVVTNVVPYIMALSGLFVMMRKTGTPDAAYRRDARSRSWRWCTAPTQSTRRGSRPYSAGCS
jgi:putrescine:ornithine antiporter